MATIEERATRHSKNDPMTKVTLSAAISNIVKDAYIAGAIEQKQIDIDRACKWFENAVRTEFIDAYECNAEELVAMFRNVMTNEK